MTEPTQTLSLAELRMHIADVVDKYFGGDVKFFSAYQAFCSSHIPIDLEDGRSACATSDLERLMRTAHNLKSILQTLGFSSMSQEAAACEQCSHSGHTLLAQASWNKLEKLVEFVIASGALRPLQDIEIGA